MNMPTSDQINSALRHVYTAAGTATAVLVMVGLSQGDATTIGNAVHQIGDGVASIIAGISALIPIASALYAAWTASPFSKLISMKKNPEIAKVEAVPGTPTAALADAIPGNKITTAAKAAIVLMAIGLASLILAPAAHAQLAVTGNVAKDLATDRSNIAKRSAATVTTAATDTADSVLAALAKPFQDLATFIGEDIDGAVALSTAIPSLQDGNGQQCWMGMQQFSAVVKAHPVPLTLKVATDLEALRLSMMAANNLCANPHCTQVFADLSNGVQQLAVGIGSSIPVPSLNAVCSKVPQIAVVAAVPATPVPAVAKP